MSSIVIRHEKDNCRFRAYLEDNPVGVLEYTIKKSNFNIKRVFVIPECRGNGIASRLTSEAENYAKTNNLNVTASCSYAQAKLTKV